MHRSILWNLALAGVLAAADGSAIAAPAAATEAGRPIHQLRIYRIHAGNEPAFHARFRDHVLRIMARHGFKVVATWESPRDGHTDFVYLLEWPDEATMKERWERFMADAEWKEVKQVSARLHGVFVDGIEERTLRPTDYSPRRTFAD